ncbi:hypothetical protein PhaeoP54_00916 [Phaeobacter inhibens]|nr:hypothetical protein PhaeoP54_00916 [Phaeobacter inhibens]
MQQMHGFPKGNGVDPAELCIMEGVGAEKPGEE